MSMQRKLKRNIEKNNNDFLKQHSKELPPGWMNSPQQDRNLLAMMARNGITQADMKREIARAQKETYELTAVATLKTVYAALSLAMMEDFKMSKEDCMHILKKVDERVGMAIDDEDIVKEMEKRVGIRFNNRDGIERIELV